MQNRDASRQRATLIAGIVLVLLALGPAAWAVLAQGGVDVAAPGEALRALGRLCGVLGLTWLLLALMLSVRVPGFDAWFGGLLRLWRIHHLLGAGSFLLLMAHPPLLALAAAADAPAAVVATLTPPLAHWALWSGWAALLVMMVFMAPTFSFFGPPRYQRWKWVHRLSAVAALLAVIHAVPLARTMPEAHALALWGSFGLLAGLAFVWRTGLSRVLARRRYRLSAVDPLAEGVVELTLDGSPLEFRAGQFVYLTPLDPALTAGRREEHPYSLSSAPQEVSPRIAIKALGDASAALLSVTPGSDVLIEGPYGRFLPARHDEPALWIGGGIGLTPFVSAARELAIAAASPDGAGPVDVALIYCANDPSRAYFLAELEAVAAGCPGFRVHPHYFAEHGPVDGGFLRHHVPDYDQRHGYICGPQPLIDLAEALLRRAGVPASHITSEEFDLL